MKSGRRRILCIEFNQDGTIGGSYFSLLFLLRNLDRSRFLPCAGFYAQHDLEEEFRQSCEQVFHFRAPGATAAPDRSRAAKAGAGGRVARSLGRLQEYAREYGADVAGHAAFLARNRFDLVHLNNNLKTGRDWMLAARLLGIPVIAHHRGYFPRYGRGDRLASRWLLSGIICISRSIRDHLVAKGIRATRLRVIHNGLDPEEFRPQRPWQDTLASLGLAETDFRVGIVGNLRHWKGQDVVVEAVRLLAGKIPRLRCLLVGQAGQEDREFSERLDSLIEGGGIGGQVLRLGYRRDIPDVMNCLDVVIHASREPEPFGRVALEAMALEKPIIASRAGGITEIVQEGETGWLVEPGDPGELAAAMERLYRSPEDRLRFGKAGRQRLEEVFSLKRNLEGTEQLYRELLGPAR